MMLSSLLIDVLDEARARKYLGSLPMDAHTANGAAFAAVLESHGSGKVVDLGSGGGVPALIVAELMPIVELCLVERGTTRAAWLVEAIERLGLEHRVRVVVANAEEAARRSELEGWADAVTARSFGPPSVTAECACRFLRIGGILIVSEPPPGPDQTARWPVAPLERTGLVPVEFSTDGSTSLQTLRRESAIETSLPRRAAVTRRRPLF